MNSLSPAGNGKVTVPDILGRKRHPGHAISPEHRITCLTAYDFPTARLLDESGVDIILVGDSLGMVVLGYDTTLPVTLDEMLHHTRAVRRGVRRALLVADMPYGSYHTSVSDGVANALRLVKEGGAEAVKVEGGERRLELISRMADAEIPVMGHVGLTPQSFNARAVEAAGAFSVVLESVPRELAATITRELRIPTIGIGAGPDCDGQVLVINDVLGLTAGPTPRFARRYAELGEQVKRAALEYCNDVRAGRFPSDAESFHLPAEAAAHKASKR
jgi:3-methyl-2-oxobutanoate hydroxymethyltransferase